MATRTAKPPAALAAYVLHRWDWSESSVILDLLTREQGRLAVVAKGAKKPHSNFRAVLLPFQRLQVLLSRPAELASGSGEEAGDIRALRSAEWAGGMAMPGGAALFSGFYLNELLMKLLARHDPHPALFDAYAQTLPRLGREDAAAQAALRAFELTLLREVGVLPDLSLATLTHEHLEPAGRYGLSAEGGVHPARGSESALAGTQWVALEAALMHGSVEALWQACAPVLAELKTMLRPLLHYHVGSPVLRTRQVMLDVQALEP